MSDNESELEFQGKIIEQGKLKPCPFCGVVPDHKINGHGLDDEILCGNNSCPVYSTVDYMGGLGLQAWNTRPIEDALQARIANLEKDLADTKEPFLYELNRRMAVTTQNTKLHRRIEELEDRIAKLESAQRWIRVEERLPDDGIAVLVWDVDIPLRGWLEDGLWQDEKQNYLGGVTHWMDLPQSPRGE